MRFKAVVVVDTAQGRGTRRGAARLTALEAVANRPIIFHALDRLVEAGAEQLIVVADADAMPEVEAAMRDYGRDDVAVTCALAPTTTDLALVLSVVAPLLHGSGCLIQPANGLLDASLDSLLAQVEAGDDVVLWTPRLVQGGDGQDGSGRSADGNRASTADESGELAMFAPGMLMIAAGWARDVGITEMPALAAYLSESGRRVRMFPLHNWHRYRGYGSDLLALNRLTLSRLAGTGSAGSGSGNRIEGCASIDPTAEVRDSVIVGPVVIGAGACISDAYIGPYTSIGTGARIEGSEVEHSIVAAGGSVMYVKGRLVASLVGGGARVFTDFSLPRALRLWVGEGDEISLC